MELDERWVTLQSRVRVLKLSPPHLVKSGKEMKFYGRLYDAMLIWYRQWYSKEWQLHTMAVVALGVSLCFNVLSIANTVSIVGSERVSYLTLDRDSLMLFFNAILITTIVINIAYAQLKTRRDRVRRNLVKPTPLPKMAPLAYMIASFAIFLATTLGALARL